MIFFGTRLVAHFQTRCRLKLFLPYGPMLTRTKNNWQKSKIFLKFRQSLYNALIETLPRSMHDFWSESVTYFQRRCRSKFFSPYIPMLTKTKKKIVKNKKMRNFEKKMVWRYGEKVPYHPIWH